MRRSVIGKISYCGIDKKRRLVAASDVKECWTAPVPLQAAGERERSVDGTLSERPRLSWASGGLWEGLEA
jgi:hypothetical protein